MSVELKFDIGPLGGEMVNVTKVRLPGQERFDNLDDLLELVKRKKND